MKNNLKRAHTLSCALIAVILLAATGCDSGTDPAPADPDAFIGAWEMTTVIMYGTPIGDLTIPADRFLEMSGTGATKSVLKFEEDGSASVTTTYADSTQDTISGTWSVDGNTMAVAGAGIDDTVQFKADATSLTITRTMAINFVPDGPKQDIVLDFNYARIE